MEARSLRPNPPSADSRDQPGPTSRASNGRGPPSDARRYGLVDGERTGGILGYTSNRPRPRLSEVRRPWLSGSGLALTFRQPEHLASRKGRGEGRRHDES